MSFSKAWEQLGKLKTAGSFEEYQRPGGKSAKSKTTEPAKKVKHALAAHSLLNMVPASQLSLAALRRP